MKRVLVLASHHNMAAGLKDTLEFVSGGGLETIALPAYVDNVPIDKKIEEIIGKFGEEDEAIILTDMTYGSVNQQFFKYRQRPHTHIVSGMNLPLAIQIAMESQEDYISVDRMREMVENAKQEIKYVNDIADDDGDEEDE